MQTPWRGWGQMVSEMKRTEKKISETDILACYVNVTRDALAWLGTRLLPCGHADVARDAPATCKCACGARDAFVFTWTRWPVDRRVDVLTWSRCDCLPTDALIGL